MDTKKALDRMMAACSRRELCVKEVRGKLERLGGVGTAAGVPLTGAQVDEIVAVLCREKFIDESRYASAFARDRSSLQGWGPLRIRRALSLKGISADDIARALETVDSTAADARLEALLRAKLRTLRQNSSQDSQALRIKILRYGLSRGYSYDQVEACFRKLCRE